MDLDQIYLEISSRYLELSSLKRIDSEIINTSYLFNSPKLKKFNTEMFHMICYVYLKHTYSVFNSCFMISVHPEELEKFNVAIKNYLNRPNQIDLGKSLYEIFLDNHKKLLDGFYEREYKKDIQSKDSKSIFNKLIGVIQCILMKLMK